jgi:hypothetical protein
MLTQKQKVRVIERLISTKDYDNRLSELNLLDYGNSSLGII